MSLNCLETSGRWGSSSCFGFASTFNNSCACGTFKIIHKHYTCVIPCTVAVVIQRNWMIIIRWIARSLWMLMLVRCHLQVNFDQTKTSFLHFLTNVCAIVGGKALHFATFTHIVGNVAIYFWTPLCISVCQVFSLSRGLLMHLSTTAIEQ